MYVLKILVVRGLCLCQAHCSKNEHQEQLDCLEQGDQVASLFLWIAKACLHVGVWPKELKESKTVVISKPGKPSYDVLKVFRPIVLLNTM